ncbi:MAG: adenosine deaminase [Pseudomonadota bacterium]
MVQNIPKAELHCHIEGAAHPDLVVRLARKYDVDVSDIVDGKGGYVWSDFTTFLQAYDRASSVFRTPDDYRLLTYDHYSRLADQNCIYAEVFASPDHAALMGIGYRDLINAMADGIEDAKAETQIEGRIIVVGLRHLGPEAVENTASLVVENPHPKVTGFGMAGDERQYSAEDFIDAFAHAEDGGLKITSHAGELCDASSVDETLDVLGVERIGHGVRAIEDIALVERIAREGVVLETCPGSNIALEVFPDFESHPFNRLRDLGVTVTLNSDDPPYFHTSLSREYEIARQSFGCSDEELIGFTRTALDAAFVDEPTRALLHKRLENWPKS